MITDMFVGKPEKSRVAHKILEGDFQVHAGDLDRAIEEYNLRMSVKKLHEILGSLVRYGYVRRCRIEARPTRAASVTDDDLGIVLGITMVRFDDATGVYQRTSGIWQYEPREMLLELVS